MPRIITVDPTGSISRIVRSAMELLDLSITQVDVPTAADALEELQRPANLVVSSFTLDSEMRGFEFALRVKQKNPDAAVLVIGDVHDPDELDEETARNSPFVYLSRPVDIHQLLRVLMAGMDGHEAMLDALHAPAAVAGGGGMDMGPVPTLDMTAAEDVTDKLMLDLGAMAVVLASRDGQIVVARGVSQIDHAELTGALAPIMMTNINVKDLIGGESATIQLYDGADYDIFVLSVGLHHFLCVVFDGQKGSQQFGMVRTAGRRAVEGLIALLGANAFFIQPTIREEPKKRSQAVKKVEEEEPVVLEHAEEFDAPTEFPEPEPAMQQMEPIQDLDLDMLFGNEGDVDESLFDLDNVEQIAKENQQSEDKLGYDEARRIGLLK